MVGVAQIVILPVQLFDVVRSHQVATLLHELVFDLAHVAVQNMIFANLDNGLINGIKALLTVAVIHRELRCCTGDFDRVGKQVGCSFP